MKRFITFVCAIAILCSPSRLNGQSTIQASRLFLGTIVDRIQNEGTTGTTLNKLAKVTGAPSTAVITGTGDTNGVIGVVVGGAGISGTALIAIMGRPACVFDGSTTSGHYVQNSPTVAGDCHDAGVGPPSAPPAGQVVGIVLSTNASAGTYILDITATRLDTLGSAGTVILVNTGSGLSGGPISASGTIFCANAAADGATKGCSDFLASDFNDNGSGQISLDYVNGQKANGSQPGFLSATDYANFAAHNGTVTTISGSGPSWLTWTIGSPTSAPVITLSATGGQTSHQVIGTCNTATSFAPCALDATDMPSAVPTSVVNDTNVTGSISGNVFTLGWAGVLAKARLIGTTVFNDQANTYSAGLQDFHSATTRLPETTVSGLPAASSNTNHIYVVTDGVTAADCATGGAAVRALCISNGTSWVALGGGSGGSSTGSGSSGYQMISEQVLGTAAPTVTFSNIPATFTNLKLVIQARTNNAGAAEDDVYVQFNGDTGANYSRQFMVGTGTGAIVGNSTGAAQIGIASAAENGTPSGASGSSTIFIPNYTRTTFSKMAFSSIADVRGATLASMTSGSIMVIWSNTAAISSILVGLTAGGPNFVTGSDFQLWGELATPTNSGVPGSTYFTSVSATGAGPNNTGTETSVIPAPNTGSKTIPVNTWANGVVLNLDVDGRYNTPASTSDTVDFKLYCGATVLADTGTVSIQNVLGLSMTNQPWMAHLQIAAPDGSGLLVNGMIHFGTSDAVGLGGVRGVVTNLPFINTSEVAATFSNICILELKAQFSAATTGESVLGTTAKTYIPGAPVTSVSQKTGAVVGPPILIQEQVLGSSAATVTFSSIPGTYRNLRIVMQSRCDSGTADDIYLQFNGDTGANYSRQYLLASVASVAAQQNVNAAKVGFATTSCASALANYGSIAAIDIPNYSGTTFLKTVSSVFPFVNGSTTSALEIVVVAAMWNSTSAITSITIGLVSGEQFVTGSTFDLYAQ